MVCGQNEGLGYAVDCDCKGYKMHWVNGKAVQMLKDQYVILCVLTDESQPRLQPACRLVCVSQSQSNKPCLRVWINEWHRTGFVSRKSWKSEKISCSFRYHLFQKIPKRKKSFWFFIQFSFQEMRLSHTFIFFLSTLKVWVPISICNKLTIV